MTTLTKAARYSRDAVKYGSIGLVLLVILVVGVLTLIAYLESRKPAAPIIPTVLFDKLPPIQFPSEKERPTSLSLQTIQGTVPEATSTAIVYQIPNKTGNLLAGQKAQQFAGILNFSPEPISKEANSYLFADAQYPARSLDFDPITGNFILVYNLQVDDSPRNGDSLPADNSKAVEEAITLLNSLGKFDNILSQGDKIISYYTFNGENYVETPNRFEAEFVRVDFMKAPINNFELKTAQPNKSSVYVILSGRRSDKERVVEIGYNFNPANRISNSTYPLKSSQLAWEELQNGGGYIANIGRDNNNSTIVRDAFIAYFDSGNYQEYLQPIIVFTGDRDFEAYVPAIDPSWIK